MLEDQEVDGRITLRFVLVRYLMKHEHRLQIAESFLRSEQRNSQNIVQFHKTRRFRASHTKIRHWPLSTLSNSNLTSSSPSNLRSTATVLFRLLLFLVSSLFHSASRTITARAFIIPIDATWPAHLVLLDMITAMTFLNTENYEAPICITIIIIPRKLIRNYSIFALSIMKKFGALARCTKPAKESFLMLLI